MLGMSRRSRTKESNSVRVKWLSGRFKRVGNSQAKATTWASSSGGKTLRPPRARAIPKRKSFLSPSFPPLAHRLLMHPQRVRGDCAENSRMFVQVKRKSGALDLYVGGVSTPANFCGRFDFLVGKGGVVLRMAHELTSRCCFKPFRAILWNPSRLENYLYAFTKRCTRSGLSASGYVPSC